MWIMGRCYPGSCGDAYQADIKGVMVRNNLLEELKTVWYGTSEGLVSIPVFEGGKCVGRNSWREFGRCGLYPNKNENSPRNI